MRKKRKPLPVVRTELNPIFEGCYTTHSDIKRANRQCENLLLDMETIAALAHLLGKDYPAQNLETFWQKVLFNQFHDILDGSAISESYRYSLNLAEEVLSKSKNLINDSLVFIAGQVNTCGEGIPLLVFNQLGWVRSEPVEFELPCEFSGKEGYLKDCEGKNIPVQVIENKKGLFIAENIPSFGYKTYWLNEGTGNCSNGGNISADRETGIFETRYYRLEVTPDTGVIRRLYDKINKKEVLSIGRSVAEDPSSYWAETCGNLLQISQEKPHQMSAWIIGNILRTENLLGLEEFKILENGPVRLVLGIKRRYSNSSLNQKIILYANLPQIDFSLFTDWQEKGSSREGVPLLRVKFRVAFDGPQAEFETPFGWQVRQSEGKELPALKVVSLAERNYRFGLLNREKYGYLVDGNNISLTILRNPYEPDPLPDNGPQRVDYRLRFGRLRKQEMAKEASSYNRPLYTVVGANRPGKLPSTLSFLKFHSSSCIPSSLYRALNGKGLMLRFYESTGHKGKVFLEFNFPVRKIIKTDLLGRGNHSIQVRQKKSSLSFNKYSLNTIRLLSD